MRAKFMAVTVTLGLALGASCLAGDAKIEQAVRDADEEWSRVAGAKDLEKTVSFYASDAVVLPPNGPMITTSEGVRNLWKGFLDTLSAISWTTTRVEASKSGDMACLIGTYELTTKDGTRDHGKYCEVWQKKGSAWKVTSDMFSSDLPAQPAMSPAPGAAEKK
jgi:ketosteroid isomerase-like protein